MKGASVDGRGPWPRVTIFSERALSAGHGTGVLLHRLFETYPADRVSNLILHGCERTPMFADAFTILSPANGGGGIGETARRTWNFAVRRLGRERLTVPQINASRLREALRRYSFCPDVVMAVCYTRWGLDALRVLLAARRPRPRAIQYFLDYQTCPVGFTRSLRAAAASVDRIWSLTPAMSLDLSRRLRRPVPTLQLFGIDPPVAFKRQHRALSTGFRAVLLGNVWNAAALVYQKRLWAACQRRFPMLPAMQWLAHPESVQQLAAAGIPLSPEIEYAGYLSRDELWRFLADADLGVVPFSSGARPASDYERFSLPSRLMDLSAAGLPLWCIAAEPTPVHSFVTEHDIGWSEPPTDRSRSADRLSRLLLDADERERLGHNARAVAERDFGLEVCREVLFREIATAATGEC